MENKNIPLIVLFLTIAYVIGFGIYYLMAKNYEFMWYIVIMIFLIGLMIKLHSKFEFSNGVLIGASIWGLMHMLGGSLMIGGKRLYSYMIWDLNVVDFAGTPIFKFDQFAHFYCYIVVTLILFYIFRAYLDFKKMNWFAVSVLLVFAGMGVGALNEIFEFLPVLFLEETGVGDYFNTMWDIVFNTLGAIAAVIWINLRYKNRI
jgi:putative membrane protein